MAVAEKLPAIVFGNKTYVCGDTGGLPVDMTDGKPVHALGLNLPEITETLINRFVPEKIAGCGFLRIDPEIHSIIDGNSITGLLVFLRQTIHCELGSSREIDLSFNSFALLSNGERLQLSSNQQAKMMRCIFKAQRSKEPAKDEVLKNLKDYEADQINELKIPSDQEVSQGIRHAVWPIAAIAFV